VKPITLKIRFGRKLANWGKLRHMGGSSYEITVDKAAPIWQVGGTLLHEFVHLIFYCFFVESAIDEKREHRVCESVDRAGSRAIRKYVRGG